MARKFSKAFYKSKQWEKTRNAFITMHPLCQRCLENGDLKSAVIVHHKVHLTPENINDPMITLGFDNLEAVCRDCHAFYHPEIYGRDGQGCRVAFDADGNVVRRNVEDLD